MQDCAELAERPWMQMNAQVSQRLTCWPHHKIALTQAWFQHVPSFKRLSPDLSIVQSNYINFQFNVFYVFVKAHPWVLKPPSRDFEGRLASFAGRTGGYIWPCKTATVNKISIMTEGVICRLQVAGENFKYVRTVNAKLIFSKKKTKNKKTTTTASRHFTASRKPEVVSGNCFLQEPMGSRLATSRLELDFAAGAL